MFITIIVTTIVRSSTIGTGIPITRAITITITLTYTISNSNGIAPSMTVTIKQGQTQCQQPLQAASNTQQQLFYWTLSERALLMAGELYLPWHQTVQVTSMGELRVGQRRRRKNRSPLPSWCLELPRSVMRPLTGWSLHFPTVPHSLVSVRQPPTPSV